MKRGVVKLTPEQLAYLIKIPINHPVLKPKLQAAYQKSHSSVQVSQEEVEYILDQLPPPGETEMARALRKRLAEFLHSLQ